MSRFLFVLIIGALAAMAIVYGLRTAQKTSSAAVTSLLPRETVAFAHVPDFNRTREQWHQSDIYQLYREPAIQDFLGKPLSRVPKAGSFSQTVHDLEQLDLKDGFLALISMANDNAKIVAGFRFHGSREDAEKVIGRWRSQLLAKGPTTNHETLDYQQHRIDIGTIGPNALATVYDGNWFLASNDVNELKAALDRVDGRIKDQKAMLNADEAFREAMAQMPASYSLLLYLQPKTFAGRLSAVRAAAAGRPATSGQRTLFEQIRSVCATTRFDNGKMHDVVFVGIPKQEEDADLACGSLALGTRETFLYVASLINFSKQLALFDPSAGGNFLGAGLQKIGSALAAAKITPDDWKAAFGSELGMLADWPGDAHWPSLVVCSSVQDASRAKKIVDVLLHGIDEDAPWKEMDRDGVHYWSMQTVFSFVAVRPTVGLSNRIAVAGLDTASVEAGIRRSANPTSEFSNSETYKRAARSVPTPTNFFAYVDLGLLYSRLDATLRPMLLMSAAFMPWMNDYVDLGKLPAAEIVTKHLSPIVSSHRYHGNGYIAESVGPITLNQSGIGIGLLAGMGALGYQRGMAGGLNPWSWSPSLAPQQVTPTPSPTPRGTP
jgi:hypothetical protein